MIISSVPSQITSILMRAHETLKFRMITHVTSAQSQDVGDVDGHLASLARLSGVVLFSDGTVSTAYFVGTTDYTKGAGTLHALSDCHLQ